jgi:hypothetical protein
MKFCKDCKWYQSETWTLPGLYQLTYKLHDEHCSNPKTSCKRADVVRGEVSDFAFKCKLDPLGLRGTLAACGPTAKWFEEKEKPIPRCEECKHLQNQYACGKAWDIALNSHLSVSMRLDELQCGKYGKWWEKKPEHRPGELIDITDELSKILFTPSPKKQSWLCRLICGRKK